MGRQKTWSFTLLGDKSSCWELKLRDICHPNLLLKQTRHAVSHQTSILCPFKIKMADFHRTHIPVLSPTSASMMVAAAWEKAVKDESVWRLILLRLPTRRQQCRWRAEQIPHGNRHNDPDREEIWSEECRRWSESWVFITEWWFQPLLISPLLEQQISGCREDI